MRLFYLLLLLAVPVFAAGAPAAPARNDGHDSALSDAGQETLDAARLERQELKSREQALRQQQHTTKSLLDKQQQYLDDLRKQVQQLKRHDKSTQAAH